MKLGHISLDGTKVKANASRHKAMSYGRIKEEEQRLREEIRALLNRAESVDAEEDAQYGADRRGDDVIRRITSAGHRPPPKRMTPHKNRLF